MRNVGLQFTYAKNLQTGIQLSLAGG